jgi:anthranilate synthase component I
MLDAREELEDISFTFRHQNWQLQDSVLLCQQAFWAIKQIKQQVFVALRDASGGFIWQVCKSQDFLTELKRFWEEEIRGNPSKMLCGFLGYDFASSIDASFSFANKKQKDDLLDFPGAYFVAFNNHTSLQYSQFKHSIQPTLTQKSSVLSFQSLISDEEYKKSISKALELIHSGRLYEINLSRPFIASLPHESAEKLFYKTFLQNPAPHSAMFNFGKNSIISASPECFLRKQGNFLSTFPIKGTRKRHLDCLKDTSSAIELLQSPKELAEHLMVVDLERNDLGRVAIPGSTNVKTFAELKSYEFVHHLVSEVSCELKPNTSIFEVLEATFPSGSITGAPKVSTMQAIAQLEPYKRQAYTGCLGFIDSQGDSVFSILIRSLFLDAKSIVLNVGGGIVADSDPEFECQETYLKSRGLD